MLKAAGWTLVLIILGTLVLAFGPPAWVWLGAAAAPLLVVAGYFLDKAGWRRAGSALAWVGPALSVCITGYYVHWFYVGRLADWSFAPRLIGSAVFGVVVGSTVKLAGEGASAAILASLVRLSVKQTRE